MNKFPPPKMKQWVQFKQAASLSSTKRTCLCTGVPWIKWDAGSSPALSLFTCLARQDSSSGLRAPSRERMSQCWQQQPDHRGTEGSSHPSESQIHQMIAPCAVRATQKVCLNSERLKNNSLKGRSKDEQLILGG